MPNVPANLNTLNRSYNPNAEFSVGNLVAFADAAGTSPTDGTGGAPTVTITRTTSSPLEGAASFLFTKDASNRQGEGFSTDIALQASDATKVVSLNFDYQITTGTYTGYQEPPLFSDLTLWFYDITNAVMYQMQGYQLDASVSTTNQYSYQGSIQIPVGCLQARVIWFLGNTGASAFTAKFNNISFGRAPRIQGTISSADLDYTPATQGFGTPTFAESCYARNADKAKVVMRFTTGTNTGSQAYVGLPTGLVIASNGWSDVVIGEWSCNDATAGAARQGPILATAGQAYVGFGLATQAGTANILTRVAGNAFPNSTVISLYFTVPIQGWGANGTIGQDADTRVIAAKYGMGATQVLAGTVGLQFNTRIYDTTNGATYGTGVTFGFVAPVSGYYRWTIMLNSGNLTSVGANGNICRLLAYANGSLLTGGRFYDGYIGAAGSYQLGVNATGAAYIQAGQMLSFISVSSGASFANSTSTENNWVEIERMSGPAQVQASEVVSSRYSTNAGQAVPNNSATRIDYEDKSYDDHLSVTTGASWIFRAPIAGRYYCEGQCESASGTSWNAAEELRLAIFLNGVSVAEAANFQHSSHSQPVEVGVTDVVNCNAGDTIDFRVTQTSGATMTLSVNTTSNHCSVHRIGGVG